MAAEIAMNGSCDYMIPTTASMSLLLWILVDAKESVEYDGYSSIDFDSARRELRKLLGQPRIHDTT